MNPIGPPGVTARPDLDRGPEQAAGGVRRQAVRDAVRIVRGNVAAFGDRYPDDTTRGGRYPLRPARDGLPAGANVGWTTSFWPGTLWLAHELTGEPFFAEAAAAHVPSFVERAEQRVDVQTHDLGFLYTLACVVPWRLTGDRRARAGALLAADLLMSRYLEPAGIVQAWGDLTDPGQRGRTIIDSLMNLPLLHWAAAETGNPSYAAAALRHARQLRDHAVRADGTTFHTFYWDPDTGEPLRGDTEQGHRDDSCWARGQAWAVYGFALSHRHTGDRTLLAVAERCALHLLDHLPADRVAYWDLAFTDPSPQPRDSSAAAIAVCGLLELAEQLPAGPVRDRCRQQADAILDSLGTGYASRQAGAAEPLLLHGVYDLPKSVGVDEGTLWGDYFYLEALLRSTRPDWRPYWH